MGNKARMTVAHQNMCWVGSAFGPGIRILSALCMMLAASNVSECIVAKQKSRGVVPRASRP